MITFCLLLFIQTCFAIKQTWVLRAITFVFFSLWIQNRGCKLFCMWDLSTVSHTHWNLFQYIRVKFDQEKPKIQITEHFDNFEVIVLLFMPSSILLQD